MRFLADENIPGRAVDALRAAGYDVEFVAESHPALGDYGVAAIAAQLHRTLLTFDKDFGEMLMMRKVTMPDGVVFFRVRASDSGDTVGMIVDTIAAGAEWTGRLTIVERDRVRVVPLPE